MRTRQVVAAGTTLVAMAVVGFLALPLMSQGRPAAAQGEAVQVGPPAPEMITRMYDVRPLLEGHPDYGFAFLMRTEDEDPCILADSGGGGAGALFAPVTPSQELTPAQHLKELIERLVNCEVGWQSAGGSGTLDIYMPWGEMIVKTTVAGHKQVAATLEAMAARNALTVVTTVQAVELDPQLADDLLARGSFAARTEDQKKALRAGIKRVFARTSLSGADGQTLSSNSGEPQTYIKDITPIVAESAIAHDPVIACVPNGLSARVRGRLLADGKAELNYSLCYARLTALRSSEFQGATEDALAKSPVELPATLSDQRAGTVRLDLGVPTVLPGGAVPLSLMTGKDADAGTTVQLDYIVTVRLLDAASERK